MPRRRHFDTHFGRSTSLCGACFGRRRTPARPQDALQRMGLLEQSLLTCLNGEK